jgi:hypothetical protein
MVSRQWFVPKALMYSLWAMGRAWTSKGLGRCGYGGEKQIPRYARDDIGALAAIALAGLKTRHYNSEKQVPRCARDDTGQPAAVGEGERTQRRTDTKTNGHWSDWWTGKSPERKIRFGIFWGVSRRRAHF